MLTRYDDILFFAPGDDDAGGGGGGDAGDSGDGDGGDDAKGDNKAGLSQADFDNLRATKDRELSELRNEFTQLKRQIEGDPVLNEVERVLAAIKDDDDDAPERLRAVAKEAAKGWARTNQALSVESEGFRDQAAAYRAAMLAQEHGGSFESYKAELLKAKTQDEMEVVYGRIDNRLTKQGRQNGNGNGSNGAGRVDNGSGSAVRSSLMEEMSKIDVTTPEGQAEWEKREAEFERKLRAR